MEVRLLVLHLAALVGIQQTQLRAAAVLVQQA
jgi:hypothetical protein